MKIGDKDRRWRTGRWRSVIKIGDEGLGNEDEPRTVGKAKSRWGREKKMRGKKEERREVGERNSEKERKRKYFLNERGERNLLKYFFFLTFMNSVHL